MQTENESFSFSEKKIANSAFDWLLFHHWNNITINYMNNLAASVLIGNGRVHPKSIQTYHRFRQAQIKKKAFLSAQWMCHLIWIYSKFWSAFICGALKGFNIQYLVCYETASRRSVLQDFTLQKAKIYTKCNVLINIYYSSSHSWYWHSDELQILRRGKLQSNSTNGTACVSFYLAMFPT